MLESLAVRTVQIALAIVALFAYIHLKLWGATVDREGTAREKGASGPEPAAKLPLAVAGAGPADDKQQSWTWTALPAPLLLWAAAILPINVLVWHTTTVPWAEARDAKLGPWPSVFLRVFTFGPVMAACLVLMCEFVLLRRKDRRGDAGWAEAARVLVRIGILDGAVFALPAAVYVAWLYPERVHGQCCAMAAAVAYAAQALVWAYFFRASRRESQAMLNAARGVV